MVLANFGVILKNMN